MPAAAIFDLDRTLVAGSTGPTFQRHLRAEGLGPDRDVPGADALYRLFNLVGENYLTMQLARAAAVASRGWEVAAVDKAAAAAADELAADVLPYARLEIEEHKAASRTVVLATTTPRQLVAPLALNLGCDEVVATNWAIDGDKFAGRIDGPFVWGRGKLQAVRRWARRANIDLRKSYAYSDSYFDGPLLAATGNPVAVNPDARLAALAVLRRWPIRFFDKPDGVIKIAGQELQELLRPLGRPELAPNATFTFSGIDNIPKSGAAIIAFNHRSYFDSTAIALLISKSGRNARFLGKKEVFDAPIIGPIALAAGGIRVDRGTGSNEPLNEAIKALNAGEVVGLAPQGTIPRGPAFFEPELKGRWGCARLAAASGAPVIPVGLWGTEKVWPRNQRLPKFSLSDRPEVAVRVGQAVGLQHDDLDADTKQIMAALVDLLPAEARQRHTPTDEELARTYPAGYKGDPERESDRRPGTDS